MLISRNRSNSLQSSCRTSTRPVLKPRALRILAHHLSLVAFLCCPAAIWADTAKPEYEDAKLTTPLSCEDFERRDDGSWLPERPFTIEGIYRGTKFRSTHGINTVIRKGVAIEGVDLGTLLDQQCAKS
jgi:hypothetical protein